MAIKKIRIATTEEGMPMSMIREVAMLKQLENYDHPNIVRFVFIYIYTSSLYYKKKNKKNIDVVQSQAWLKCRVVVWLLCFNVLYLVPK